jgi:hypothetical protein
MPSCDPALSAAHVVRFLGRHRPRHRRHGAPGLRPPAHALRRARLARDVLHDRNGALADQRDRHRMGAHAVACDAAGRVGSPQQSQRRALNRWRRLWYGSTGSTSSSPTARVVAQTGGPGAQLPLLAASSRDGISPTYFVLGRREFDVVTRWGLRFWSPVSRKAR